nr:MAG: hypothetical protein [Lake Baikal virophage 6]
MVLFDLRNRINNEAVWEDKRINQKVFEKEQQQVATMGMSERPPNDKLQAIAYQFNKDVENVKSALQGGLTQLDPQNPFADFSPVSLAWNKLIARVNPYLKGQQQSATLTLPTAGDYAFVRQTLYDGLYSFTTNAIQQINSWKKDLENIGDVPEAQGEKAVEDIRNQVMTGFYKTVAYGSERRSGIDPNRLPSNTTSGSTSLGQSGIATPLGLRQAVQQGLSQNPSQQGSQQSSQQSTQPSTNPSSGALTPQQQGQPAGAVAQQAVAQFTPQDKQNFQAQVAIHTEDIPLRPENARMLATRMENDIYGDLPQAQQRTITQNQRDREVDRLEEIMPDLLLDAGYGGQAVAPPQQLPPITDADRAVFREYETAEGQIPADADVDAVGQAVAEWKYDQLSVPEKEAEERLAQANGTTVVDEIKDAGMEYALLVPTYLARRNKKLKLKPKINLGNIFQAPAPAQQAPAPAERQLDITPLRKGKGSKEKNDKSIRQFIADEGVEVELRGWGQMSQAQRASAKPIVALLAKKFDTTPKFMNSWLSENRIVGNGADMEGSGFFDGLMGAFGDGVGSLISSGVGNIYDRFKAGTLLDDAKGALSKGMTLARALKQASGSGAKSAPRGRPLRLADVFDGNSAIRPNSLADLKNRYRGNEYIGDSTGAIIPSLMNRGVLGSGISGGCGKAGCDCMNGGARCCFNSKFCKGTEHYKREKPDNWVPSKRPTAQGVKQRRRDWNVLVQAPANARPLVWKKTPVVIQEQGHRRKRRSDAGRPRRPRGAGAEEGMVGGGDNVAVNVKYASLPKALQPTPEDLMPKAKPTGGARQRRPRLPQQSYEGYHDEENDAQKVYENMSGLGRQQESEMMKTEMLQDRALGLLKGLPRRLGVEDPKYKNKK